MCALDSGWYLVRAIGLVVLGVDHPLFLTVLGAENAAIVLTLTIVVGSLCLSAIAKERALRAAHRLAIEDPLTGLLNRREFIRHVEEMSISDRKSTRLNSSHVKIS